MKHLSAILALTILLTVGLACSDANETTTTNNNTAQPANTTEKPTAAKNDSTGGVYLEWVKLYKDDGSGSEGEEVTDFKPNDNPQHFVARMSEFEGGTKIKAVIIAVNAGGEKNFKILEKELETTSLTNQSTFSLKMPNPFPVGDYKAEFYVNGKLSKTVNYKVE